MISLQTKAYVGPDGTLSVKVPTPLREIEVDVMLVLQPLAAPAVLTPAAPTPEELGWPPGFFEATFGSLKDDPIERGPQGEYEVREVME